MNPPLPFFTLIFITLIAAAAAAASPCRSYCGNLTVDYPFATRPGCGHPGYRDLLFCVNDVLMLHLSSGSYRVLDLDYSFHALTLHDPFMSNCAAIVRHPRPNGLVLDPSRAPFLAPSPDNVFLLLGCTAQSPLFQGFPGKHLPCRNVSGMGCEDYYSCPAWASSHLAAGSSSGSDSDSASYSGSDPGRAPRCCSVSYEAIRAINLTKLECQGYSSAYSVAPLRVAGPSEWAYGIRMTYSVPGDYAFCRACEATRGTCGYDVEDVHDLCLCGSWNSTSNCDSVNSSERLKLPTFGTVAGLLTPIILWMVTAL